eukprot:COSAG01_NODE_56516_length_317_cov_181.642202_1_plen_38_part_10
MCQKPHETAVTRVTSSWSMAVTRQSANSIEAPWLVNGG